MKKLLAFVIVLAFLLCLNLPGFADTLSDAMTAFQPQLDSAYSVQVSDWKFDRPDFAGGENPALDDSSWQSVAPGFSWTGENTNVWFRTHLTIPNQIGGHSTAGMPIRLDLGVDDDGELYIGGQLRERFHWDDCHYTLTNSAQPGTRLIIAVRGLNGPGNGQLRSARLVLEALPEFGQYLNEIEFLASVVPKTSGGDQAVLAQALRASESHVDPADLSVERLDTLRHDLVAARAELAPISRITRRYDVYYIGHAHIDMNWLWNWASTLDACRRTWNSALNLMDEFGDFSFVQSQPGAYSAIQKLYPDEFRRMQAATKRGQWDPVGGLWDESDTDMPSGEGLARSFLLGQRYFKAEFGRYATTGWLPDSFGHSWQMPQLMRLSGIDAYYHMRCGNGMMFTWWESPDGSKVLKANTDSYDTDVRTDQLGQPWDNQKRFGLQQTLVVFGVGDHGGGPTREMVLKAKSFQNDPLLPKVHLTSADRFFSQLAQTPQASSLPVVDQDLQYVFTGCYTTHADMKKAVRSSENNLYTAEVLSSLDSMRGHAYPTAAFREAWKPTAFAQFHDIMCGSAIHSTYDWMHEQLKPAFAFEASQTGQALADLTRAVDTRGASKAEMPIVVWNVLSFARDDIVRVTLAHARMFHSVRDSKGNVYPAQALNDSTLEFVAHDVPAFSHAVYFASAKGAKPSDVSVTTLPDSYLLQNSKLRVVVDRGTGLVRSLIEKNDGWEVAAKSAYLDGLEILGDNGSAWDIGYTGEKHDLTTDGVSVSVEAQGPVFDTIRVHHAYGMSAYDQLITLYAGLGRVDVPTTIDWHEHHELVKICFPVNGRHIQARVGIPYGSISRPTTGQENPGQKWMDVSDYRQQPVSGGVILDLRLFVNQLSTVNFDNAGIGYSSALMPRPGVYRLGSIRAPFRLFTGNAASPDNIACNGQFVPLPKHVARGDVLLILGASAPSGQAGQIQFIGPGSAVSTSTVDMNDWVVPEYADNQVALTFATRSDNAAAQAHFWISQVPIASVSATKIRLPYNRNFHIFAITVASVAAPTPIHGLCILNDSKYGSDTNGNLFRLTALRSSTGPDPDPDEGLQQFSYSLYPHEGDWRVSHAEQAGLAFNIGLIGVPASPHAAATAAPLLLLSDSHGYGDLLVGAFKHSEDGPGYILRFFETQGRNTTAVIKFSRPVHFEETDIIERPLHRHLIFVKGDTVTMPIGHDQIVTLHITSLPDATSSQPARASILAELRAQGARCAPEL